MSPVMFIQLAVSTAMLCSCSRIASSDWWMCQWNAVYNAAMPISVLRSGAAAWRQKGIHLTTIYKIRSPFHQFQWLQKLPYSVLVKIVGDMKCTFNTGDIFFIVRLTTILYCMWIAIIVITSCARGDTICLRPLQVDNIFAFIRQVAPVPACWLFKTSATSWPSTFWPSKWCPSHVWRGLPVCQF